MTEQKKVKASWGGHRPYGHFGGEMGLSPVGNAPMPEMWDKHKSRKPSHGSKGSKGSKGSYLQDLVGMLVKINRGGPDSVEGTLVSIQSGYLVLSTCDGTVYVNAKHVKSITEVAKKKKKHDFKRKHKFIVAHSFKDVLRKLIKKFAKINWGGPEKLEGFIAGVDHDYLMLVVDGKEIVRIPLYHIKTVKHCGKYASNGSQGSRGDKDHKDDKDHKSTHGSPGSHGSSPGSHGSTGGSHGSKGTKGSKGHHPKKGPKGGRKTMFRRARARG